LGGASAVCQGKLIQYPQKTEGIGETWSPLFFFVASLPTEVTPRLYLTIKDLGGVTSVNKDLGGVTSVNI
jgi:hypothetical protein